MQAMEMCPVCKTYHRNHRKTHGDEAYYRALADKFPKLSATISVKPAEEDNIKGLDVTCGDTTFIPVEVEDDDS